MIIDGFKRLGIWRGRYVEMAEVKEVNGHVMLPGAEEFRYGGSIGMPVSRIGGTSFVTLAESYADSGIVITKKNNGAQALYVSKLQHAFLIMWPPLGSSSAGLFT